MEDNIKVDILDSRCVYWIQLAQQKVKRLAFVKGTNRSWLRGWGRNVAIGICKED